MRIIINVPNEGADRVLNAALMMSAAVEGIKSQFPDAIVSARTDLQPTPHLVLVCDAGLITDILSSEALDVTMIDYSVTGMDASTLIDVPQADELTTAKALVTKPPCDVLPNRVTTLIQLPLSEGLPWQEHHNTNHAQNWTAHHSGVASRSRLGSPL